MEKVDLYKQIGGLIKSRRKALKLNQEKLAQSLGISRASLANVEVGRQAILVHQLYGYAEALDLPLSDLLPQKLPTATNATRKKLPLPKGLTERQSQQIAALLIEDAPIRIPTKGESSGR